MPQLYSQSLELQVLRTITSTHIKKASKIASKVNEDCFQSRVAKDTYSRIMAIAKSRNIFLTWDELLHDTVLKQSVRKVLNNFKKKPYRKSDEIKRKLKQLNTYRQLRAIYFAANYAMEALDQESADPDIILSKVMDKLNNAKPSTDQTSNMVHIGGNDKSADKLLEKVLNPPKNKYIRIGLKAFEKYNPGLPRGAYVNISSITSGGKSVLGNQLAANTALNGARVCLIQLEMDDIETGQRQVSRFSKVEMTKVNDPHNMQLADQKQIKKSWANLQKRIKKRGGLLTIWTPDEDMTADQMLTMLEPFGYDVKIFDQIGLFAGTDGDDQVKALSRIGRLMKRNAHRTKSINITLSQLNEEGKVKYSRAITEHAQVAFQWNPDAKAKENRIYQVTMPKSRNLKPVTFYLKEHFDIMKFEDVSENEAKKYRDSQDSDKQKGNKGNKNGKRRNGFSADRKEHDNKDYYTDR